MLSRMQIEESQRLIVPLPPKVVEVLDRSGEIAFGRYALMIDRGAAVQIVEAVRNLALDWAIRMEAAGVTGSDFSFTPEERDAAKAAPSPIQIGSIHTFAGNLGGAGNTTGDITLSHVDVPAATALVAQIERYLPQLEADGIPPADLRRALDALRQETVQPEHIRGQSAAH